MATASEGKSEDLFSCHICLHVFTDPVSLSCGHNFCKTCVEQFWSNAVYWKCPSCKKQFNTKPELTINTFISKMAEFRLNQPHTAQKSSLVSYYQSDIKPHLTMPGLKTHQLIEPQGDLQKRVCPQHNKLLELFCITDQLCVCMLCTYSEHKAHEVVPLKEASEQQKLQLKKTEANIIQMINMRMIKIKELHLFIEQSNANAVKQIAEGVKVLKDLLKFPRLTENIKCLKTVKEDQANHYIHELEQEISVLETKKTEVEKFLKSEDKLHLFQNMQISSIPTTKDWTNVTMSPPLYSGIVARALSQLEDELSKTTKKVFEAELKRAKSFEQDVKLDCDSADPRLTVSMDCKSVVHSSEMRHTRDIDKRFDGLFVLGKQSFTESFYFEVVVSKKPVWTVGVAREGVQKKGIIILIPKNGFWTIGLREDTLYASDDTKVILSTKCKPTTVGVFVNKEKSLISFFDVKATSLIYSFNINYIATNLQPICNPGLRNLKNVAPLKVGLSSPPVQTAKFPKLHRDRPKLFLTLPHRQAALPGQTATQIKFEHKK